jgi:hypothetical protein
LKIKEGVGNFGKKSVQVMGNRGIGGKARGYYRESEAGSKIPWGNADVFERKGVVGKAIRKYMKTKGRF